MENNRDRKGIFLGVISVATLIVAIIGATFAYFSASFTGNEEVNFTAYEFSASATVNRIAPSSDVDDLIPVDAANVFTLASNTRNNNKGACKDATDYTACLIYEVTIYNSGSQDLSLTGELKTTTASAFTHLKLVPATVNSGTYTADGDVMSIGGAQDATTGIFTSSSANKTFTVQANDDSTFYFIIYLENAIDSQTSEETSQNEEMGATYVGQLVFSSGTGGQLKATITTG